jgi:hypothetical protein
MHLNVRLNDELGIRIYSFPMRYQPTDLPDRSHVGPRWNRYYLRSLQLILQATHGVVSGEPVFHKAAFGGTADEFEAILARPHHMIFNRHWFERYEGRAELSAYHRDIKRLSASDRGDLLAFLSSRNPAEYAKTLSTLPARIRHVARYYVPLTRRQELKIRATQQARRGLDRIIKIPLAPDEIVEDAGLEEGAPRTGLPKATGRRKVAA